MGTINSQCYSLWTECSLVIHEVSQEIVSKVFKGPLLVVGCVNVYCAGKSWQYLRWQLVKVIKVSVYSDGVVAHGPLNSLLPCFCMNLSYSIPANVCFVGKQSMQAHTVSLRIWWALRKRTKCFLVPKMLELAETSKKGEKCNSIP